VTLLPRPIAAAALREGRVAVHRLPPEEGAVATLFIRRRDTLVSSALAAFLEEVRPRPIEAEAAE
jgi:hypothetical protein